MDPADYSLQLCRLGDRLLEVVSGEADTEEKLRAIASFDEELFIRPWLKAIPCVALFKAELANLRKALVASATAKLPAPASAPASAKMSPF